MHMDFESVSVKAIKSSKKARCMSVRFLPQKMDALNRSLFWMRQKYFIRICSIRWCLMIKTGSAYLIKRFVSCNKEGRQK